MHDADLKSALADELASATAFCTLLDTEREALTTSDLEQVAAISAEKLVLARRLQRCSSAREEVCSKARTQQRDALADAARQYEDPLRRPEVAPLWTKVSAQLERAQEANRINGLLISSRLATVGNAINALHQAAGNAPVYASDGFAKPVGTTTQRARWQA